MRYLGLIEHRRTHYTKWIQDRVYLRVMRESDAIVDFYRRNGFDLESAKTFDPNADKRLLFRMDRRIRELEDQLSILKKA